MRSRLSLLLIPLVTRCVCAAMTVGDPRCEYARDPLGIDTLQPRLSWVLLDDEARGQIQTAYQIRVAENVEALTKGKDLLWDSDKTVSDSTVHIVYDGQPLRSGMRCYWQVRAWDRKGNVTPWSEPAFWQVALLEAGDWKARWIGLPGSGAPQWKDFTLSADITLQKEAAGILFRCPDAANGYMWQFNNAIGPDPLLRPHVQKNGQWTMLPAIPLRKAIPANAEAKPHRITIEVRGATIRTSVDGQLVDERQDITFSAGTIGFRADSKEHFAVDNLTVTDASGGELLKDTFDGPSKAFPKGKTEKGLLAVNGATLLFMPPLPKDCPRLRKTFLSGKPLRRATASVCGLGFYELYVNGKKSGDSVLAPPNTPYSKRILFDTLDVTPLIQSGTNTVGLWLAPGYSDDYSKWGWKWEAPKQAILQLDLVYEDGTTDTVVTDGSWQSGPSPLTFASLYDGEVFDASLEKQGWCNGAFSAEGWQPAVERAAPKARLLPNIMPPLRVTQTIRPVACTEPKPGVFVFDMGQNFAGWVRLRANGPRGTRITVRHSELLGEDGLLDTFTNRRAKSTDAFVLAGTGEESYEPRFTYHGFRFIEVTGYPGQPGLDDVTGCVVHADVEPAGAFTCSDPLLCRVYSNCVWSMRSNFMGIPTDCCMRDERTPCQMDSLAYEDAALATFRMNRFYTKWLDDVTGGMGNPDWNGDAVFLPWRLYRHDGDIRILERHYDNMRGLIDHLHAKAPDHIYTDGFGDWCPPNDGTWQGYHGDVTEVNTCLYAALTRIVSETANLLGKREDAARYSQLADAITRAFNEKCYDAGRAAYGDGSQTTALMPLALGLVPADRKTAVFKHLADTIRTRDKCRLDTGIFGTRYLFDVLCDFGEADLGVTLLTQPEYPGFGFQIAHGATTLWEQWTIKGGMNSHNHAMFAGVCSAFYTHLGGITALKPGFAEIGIAPVMPSCLTYAEATQDTVKGRVSVRWHREEATVILDVTVPVNTTARLTLPCVAPKADKEKGVTLTERSDGQAVYTLGSGTYRFVMPARSPGTRVPGA